MNGISLYESIGYIDDDILERSERRKGDHKRTILRWGAAAACLCVALLGAAALLNSGVLSADPSESAASPGEYHVFLYQGDCETENAALVNTGSATAEESITIPGISGEALYVAPESGAAADTEAMSVEEANKYAYLELDGASPELAETILEAREVIIYSKSWVADGYSGYIEDVNTGERKMLPLFSELFPGWDMPAAKYDEGSITEDGLGANELYGITVQVIEIADNYMICRPIADNLLFWNNRNITVSSLDGSDVFRGLKVGDTVFVAYYGKDCSVAKREINALSIE